MLEIGCGWGGFAEFAAKEVGAKVTGITISQAQHDFARKRLFEQGLAEKAGHPADRLSRRRAASSTRVASIEMFEAVGERYWPTYFGKIRDVLSPGGRAGLQIITIRDELFARYRRRTDFIQRYVFPGGMLPSEARLKQETARPPAWPGPDSTASARTTPTPWPNGPRGSRRPGTTSRAWASTSGSGGCGGSI